MGPTLRTSELAAWARSRKLNPADEWQLRAVFEERDRLERLRHYADHTQFCARMVGAGCDCGYDRALSGREGER
jgi:hypothetical protein